MAHAFRTADTSDPTLVYTMGLTRKSKRFLEILMLSGLDSLAFAANPKALIYDAVGWSSDRAANRHLVTMTEKGLISLGDKRDDGAWVAQLTDEGKTLRPR